ncbi:NAD(P)-dependent oxidoreductase, partial [Morganella morganii]|nr:NAD(P)-dependent oxidoreductase [Morganella morganii]
SHPATENRRIDATGTDYHSYLEKLRNFITTSGKKWLMSPLPTPLRLISVHILRLITTVTEGIAKELSMGLKNDLPGDGKPL